MEIDIKVDEVVKALRDRLGELEWELAVTRARAAQAEAQVAELTGGSKPA